MSAEAGNKVKNRGPWTYVQKVKSGNETFHMSVTSAGEPPRDAVELAWGFCGKARCEKKPLCYRQVRFDDGHRGYEFSCLQHRDAIAEKKSATRKSAKKKIAKKK
jgi:hypothetical protein